MDKFRVVSLFISVARAGSFSQAAADAGLTPQAVSKAIRQLETHVGVRLFHRTTRSLSLTEEGERLYALSQPGLALFDDALEQVKSSRQETEGLVRVAAASSIGHALLAPMVAEFHESFPGIQVEFVFDDHFTDLIEARIDVGFRAGNPPERNLVARKLGEIALLVCAAPSYLAKHGAPATVEDLARHRCTGFRNPNSGRLIPWELQLDGATVYKDVPAVASFNTVEGEVEAVRAGAGIGQLSRYMVRNDLEAGRLVHLLPELVTANGAVYMYYQQRTQMPHRVRCFIDFAAERLPAHLL
jgi:DNA-binding transcriptional LysR family regulator